MKRGIKLLLCIAISASAWAQTPKEKFIQYGLLVDRAKATAAHGNHVQAVAIYDSAFALIPFMGYDHVAAAVNALIAGRDDRANDLLIHGTEHGVEVERQYVPELQEFLRSERSMPYLNMRQYMQDRWLAHADTVYIRKLQEVGNGNHMVLGANGDVVQVTDSTAFNRLMELVRANGFPSPLTVGSKFYLTQSLFFNQLDNYPDSPEWRQILPYIQTALNRGALPPDFLAPFQDMADVDQGKPMTYGELLPFNRDDPSKWYFLDRTTLNSNRAAIGRGPIEDLAFRLDLDLSEARFAEP